MQAEYLNKNCSFGGTVMKKLPFCGVCTALVTPFHPSGEVDFPSLNKLLSWQKEGGVKAVVLLGTTGESCTLSLSEKRKIFLAGRRAFDGFLMMGCGSNDTKTAVILAQKAKEWGADGVLAVTPYYNKCTQKGAIAYYGAIAEVGLPVLAYNVPQRTGFDLAPETAYRLVKDGVIFGVKEACGDVKRGLLHGANGVPYYSGDDLLNLPFYSAGAEGCVSVISNLLPRLSVEIWNTFFSCPTKAMQQEKEIRPLLLSLGAEVNPILIKYALSCRGLCGETVRAPLTVGEAFHKKAVKKQLLCAKILSDAKTKT